MPPRNQQRPRQTIRGAVEQQGTNAQQRKSLDDEVRAALPYIKAIVPSHVNAAQYVAAVIGLLHKSEDLTYVALRNQPSFMAALADCARLGLWPGDGYAFVPLGGPRSTADPETLGVVEYTGEIQLMYRSGGVASVVAENVREHDYFRRGRHLHEPPEFAPRTATGQADDFASDEERGGLKGTFCYAVLETGAISRVIIMGRAEVMKHKAVARSKAIWEGEFEPSMWLKTGVHELRKWVPLSAEYLREQFRAQAELQATPLGQLPASPAVTLGSAQPANHVPAPPPARAIANGEDGGAGQDPPQGRQRRKGRQVALDIPQAFDALGLDDAADRRAQVQAILGDEWDGKAGLTDQQSGQVRDVLNQAVREGEAKNNGLDLLRQAYPVQTAGASPGPG